MIQESSPFNEISGTLEGMSVTFFACYAAFKTAREYKCDLCLVDMHRPPYGDEGDINDTYINCREYQTKKSCRSTMFDNMSAIILTQNS